MFPFIRQWIANSKLIFTNEQLSQIHTLNSNYSGGGISGILGSSDSYSNIKARELKSFYLSKFIFNDPSNSVDTLLLRNFLWQWGEVAIVKYNDKYLIGTFKVNIYDYNNFPKNIDFIPISTSKKKTPLLKRLEVGEEVAIIRGGPGYWLDGKMYFSPFFMSISLLKSVYMVRVELLKNVKIGRTILSVPGATDNAIVDKLENLLLSGRTVLPLSEDITQANSARMARSPLNKLLDTFNDRTKELIMTYNHLWDEIKSVLGAETNNNPDKQERQISKELSSHNALSRGINKTELEYIKQGVDTLNKTFNLNISVKLNSEGDIISKNQKSEDDTNAK